MSLDLQFVKFVKLCEKLRKQKRVSAKQELIKSFLETCDTTKTLTLLTKATDQKRDYVIGEYGILCIFAHALQLNRFQMEQLLKKHKDVGVVICKQLKAEPKPALTGGKVTFSEVYELLMQMSSMETMDGKKQLLYAMIPRMDASELRCFGRLLDGNLRLKTNDKTILNAVSDKLNVLFNACKDLDFALRSLSKGPSELIQVLRPFVPMTAEQCSSYTEAFKHTKSGRFLVDDKIDGFSVVLHVFGSEFKCFTRKMKTHSEAITKAMCAAVKLSAPDLKSAIIDGEVVAVNCETGKRLPFGAVRNVPENASLCFYGYDLLHLNGRSLIDCPLTERRETLERSFQRVANKFQFVESAIVSTPNELKKIMRFAIAERREGLVLKDPESKYQPGTRNWLKMKKGYLEEGDFCRVDMDLVILGADLGTGKYATIYKSFVVGCFDEDKSQFQSVCNVTIAPTVAKWMTENTPTVAFTEERRAAVKWLNITKKVERIFVNPKKSIVVRIRGAQFTVGSTHTAKDDLDNFVTVREPRVRRLFLPKDKGWKDATTAKQLKALIKQLRENPLVPFAKSAMSVAGTMPTTAEPSPILITAFRQVIHECFAALPSMPNKMVPIVVLREKIAEIGLGITESTFTNVMKFLSDTDVVFIDANNYMCEL